MILFVNEDGLCFVDEVFVVVVLVMELCVDDLDYDGCVLVGVVVWLGDE